MKKNRLQSFLSMALLVAAGAGLVLGCAARPQSAAGGGSEVRFREVPAQHHGDAFPFGHAGRRLNCYYVQEKDVYHCPYAE